MCLEEVKHSCMDMLTKYHVVIDRSRVLLLSFLKFTMKSHCIRTCTDATELLYTGCSSTEDLDCTFVLACISHVMHSFKADLKRIL